MKVNVKRTAQNNMQKAYLEMEARAIDDTVYLCVIALNLGLGIGKKRLSRFADTLNEVTAWFSKLREESGDEYAHIKLAEALHQITGDTYDVPLSSKEMELLK